MRNADHVQATQAGSLPRPDSLMKANHARAQGTIGSSEFDATVTRAVTDLVDRQREIGIDVVGDGEFGKSMSQAVDYGAWWSYSFQRLDGLELSEDSLLELGHDPAKSTDEIVLGSFGQRRDRERFADAYDDPDSGIATGRGRPGGFPAFRGPVRYVGHEAIRADIAHFQQALRAAGRETGFMTAIGPGSAARLPNEHYDTDEELLFACAEAMREEYQAILDAGLLLQIDDPCIAENWDQFNPEPSVEAYQRFTRKRVEALNHALRGLPQDRIRFHLCWGSWHGPHTTDLPMRDLVDVLLEINAGGYAFEAGNARHEHEWKVWQDITLPDDKVLIPGVVSHATNVVEHPELVADRIVRFAECVGRERVIANTDCGLGGRLHPDIAWAKLESLTRGAEIATQRLW